MTLRIVNLCDICPVKMNTAWKIESDQGLYD